MLPKIDANFGRAASRREILQSRSGEAAVVPLPRLRLLKQVAVEEADPTTSPAYPSLESAPAPLPPPQRRLLRSRADSADPRPGSGSQPPRRGRGLLRPLDLNGEAQAPRSPPPLPRPDREASLPVAEHEGDSAALLQQRARERVKEQRRAARRQAREEEDRRRKEEQERIERAERSASQVEAHRRDLARHAAERARRSREDREDKAQEREELQSARRERMRRYQNPSQRRDLARLDTRRPSRASPSGGSEPEASAAPDEIADVCSCGCELMPDSAFCRKCGEKRPGGPKEASPQGRGGSKRAGRAPVDRHGSRDRERRRRHGGRSRGGARDRERSQRAAEEPEDGKQADGNGGVASGEASDAVCRDAVDDRNVVGKQSDNGSYHQQHLLKGIGADAWALLYAPFGLPEGARTEPSPAQQTAAGAISAAPAELAEPSGEKTALAEEAAPAGNAPTGETASPEEVALSRDAEPSEEAAPAEDTAPAEEAALAGEAVPPEVTLPIGEAAPAGEAANAEEAAPAAEAASAEEAATIGEEKLADG